MNTNFKILFAIMIVSIFVLPSIVSCFSLSTSSEVTKEVKSIEKIVLKSGFVDVKYRTVKTILDGSNFRYGFNAILPTNKIDGWVYTAKRLISDTKLYGDISTQYTFRSANNTYIAGIKIKTPKYYLSKSLAENDMNKKINEMKSKVKNGNAVPIGLYNNRFEKVNTKKRQIGRHKCTELIFTNEINAAYEKANIVKMCLIVEDNILYELVFYANELIYENMEPTFEKVIKNFKPIVSEH